MKKKCISIILIVILLFVALFFGYTGSYYRCTDSAEAIADTDSVKIKKTVYGYFYDGPGSDKCLIFYPGGLVEDISYGNLLKRIADEGIDCALVHMQFNLAVFSPSAAGKIRNEYDYDHWYIGGHSLGGAMAADYAAGHASEYDGLLLLAAYPTKDLSSTDLHVLTVYGSNDHVVNMDKIKSGRRLMPDESSEKIIDGGNHGHFGNYGHQKGDGKATITNEEQQAETAELVDEFFN